MKQIASDAIVQLLCGHMSFKYVAVASEIGIFPALASGPLTLAELAQRTDVPPYTLRILAHALLSCGWIEREGERYRNGPVGAACLSGGPGPDLRPLLRLWDRVVYDQWRHLEQALRAGRTGQATFGFADFDAEQRRTFSLGTEALTAPSALALAYRYEFARHRRLLDLGGGTGSFLLAARQQHPGLEMTLFESPAAAAVARQRLAQADGLPAVNIVEGNFLADPIPAGHDAVLLANVLHLFSPAVNQGLLARVRAAVPAGARLLLVDYFTDPSHTEPSFATLFAGEFLLVTGQGDIYSTDEVHEWLRQTGWRPLSHAPLAGAASLVVAEA